MTFPDLIEIQRKSFFWFLKKGLKDEFENFSKIQLKNLVIQLDTQNYKFKKIQDGLKQAEKKSSTYLTQIYIPIKIIDKKTGSIKRKKVFFGSLPLMTDRGKFYINGV